MLPKDIFGQPLVLEEPYRFNGLPLAFASGYNGTRARIGETPCIVIEPKEQLRLTQATLVAESISERENTPCVVYAPHATAYQRKALVGQGIAWILGEDTFSLPFLAASCNKADLRQRRPMPLSPNAQRIAVHAIDGTWLGLTATDLAQQLDMSLSSTCNYLRELEAAVSGLVPSRGRTRYLAIPEGTDAATLYESLHPYLQSPVARRVFLKEGPNSAALRQLPASGITALSLRTNISDEPWKTYAVYTGNSDQVIAGTTEVTPHDDPDVLLEVWRYRIDSQDGTVDDVSLLLNLEEIATEQQDERLDDAVAQFRTEVGL